MWGDDRAERGSVTSYTYDNMDRLTVRTDPLLRIESYQYHVNGNLTQHTDRRGKVTAVLARAPHRSLCGKSSLIYGGN